MAFEDQYRKDNDELYLDQEAHRRIGKMLAQKEGGGFVHQQDTGRAPHVRYRRITFALAGVGFAAALCVLLMVGVQATRLLRTISDSRSPSKTSSKSEVTAPTYDDIYDALLKAGGDSWDDVGFYAGGRGAGSLEDRATSGEMSAQKRQASPEADVFEDGQEVSQTNVQVEGIDEADIVKSDGNYLYTLADNRLIIVRANKKNTKVVSDTTIGSISDTETSIPLEMFLAGNRLIVVFAQDRYVPGLFDDGINALTREDALYDMRYPFRTRTLAITYDISKPATPKEMGRVGQDGYYVTSRLQDDIIYLVTTHYVYEKPDPNDPQTFLPCTYNGEEKTPFAEGSVILPECPNNIAYAVITSMSVQTGKRIDQAAILGYTSTVYMSYDSLVIAGNVYETELLDTTTSDQYEVAHYKEQSSTHLVRFAIDQGQMSFAAEGAVAGELLNQFSLDQYEGHLRVVTTVSPSEYKTYTDPAHDFENYEWLDVPTTNALYVMDLDCQVVGKLTDLAEDERVYSVRFAGDIGYLVTFRQVDPLFVVDLADPQSPRIIGQLKIPGFSQYLHVYSEELLFGLGREVDPDTDIITGMKLSMFDISDPDKVTERHKLLLDSDWSEALYNHKAIMVLPDKDIIAFPTEYGYAAYGYSDQGFFKRGEMKMADAWQGRGVLIDDILYICTPERIGVFELTNFTPLCDLAL